MSIIRQRKLNLIMSWFFGFICAGVILVVGGYLLREPIVTYLDVEPAVVEEAVVKVPMFVAARPIAQGSILEANDITTIMVETGQEVPRYYDAVEELIGQKVSVNIDKNLPLTPPLFYENILTQQGLRLYEVSFVELPYHLSREDYVDVRIAFPTGQEYIVLGKKQVMGFERSVQNVHQGLLSLALEEVEALRMSSALVDMYIAKGARIYMAKYVDPTQQEASLITYPVNEHVLEIMKENPSILTAIDPVRILESRQEISQALLDILDENQDPLYVIDLSTPQMNMEPTTSDMEVDSGTAQEANNDESEQVKDTVTEGSSIGF